MDRIKKSSVLTWRLLLARLGAKKFMWLPMFGLLAIGGLIGPTVSRAQDNNRTLWEEIKSVDEDRKTSPDQPKKFKNTKAPAKPERRAPKTPGLEKPLIEKPARPVIATPGEEKKAHGSVFLVPEPN